MKELFDQVTLRSESEDDKTFLLRLFASSHADLEWADISRADKEALVRQQFFFQQQQLHEIYPNATYSVVLLADEPIGRICIHHGETAHRILDIALLPPYRDRGIGTKLLTIALAEARAVGKSVRLQVAWHNNSAAKLYEALGFRVAEDKGVCREMQWTSDGKPAI